MPSRFLNRDQNPVVLAALAVEVYVAGSIPTLDAKAGRRPLLEQFVHNFQPQFP